MTPKQFIEKAIKGGWSEPKEDCSYCKTPMACILLDTLAWQAVGKLEGWGEKCSKCKRKLSDYQIVPCGACATWKEAQQKSMGEKGYLMHRMIDALVEGKSIESFLETL